MSKKTKIIIGITGLILLIVVAGLAYSILSLKTAPGNSTTSNEIVTAPDFTVTAIDGTKVTLSSLKGTPVILNFWASWCPPCQKEMPDLQKQFELHGDTIVFMMIDLTDGQQETKESATSFIEKNQYTFPIYFDETASAITAYNIASIPMTFFINRDGNIVKSVNGMLTEKTLLEGIFLYSNFSIYLP